MQLGRHQRGHGRHFGAEYLQILVEDRECVRAGAVTDVRVPVLKDVARLLVGSDHPLDSEIRPSRVPDMSVEPWDRSCGPASPRFGRPVGAS